MRDRNPPSLPTHPTLYWGSYAQRFSPYVMGGSRSQDLAFLLGGERFAEFQNFDRFSIFFFFKTRVPECPQCSKINQEGALVFRRNLVGFLWPQDPKNNSFGENFVTFFGFFRFFSWGRRLGEVHQGAIFSEPRTWGPKGTD